MHKAKQSVKSTRDDNFSFKDLDAVFCITQKNMELYLYQQDKKGEWYVQ